MAAGIEARERGKTVLLVEHNVLGGTCLNVGCVPSKRLLAASGHRHAAATNPFLAAPTSAAGVDLPALIAQKQQLVDALRDATYQAVADAHNFPIRYGHARFTDEKTLDVDGEQLTAPAFLIATGSTPATPDLPGIDAVDFLTSTTAMEQTALTWLVFPFADAARGAVHRPGAWRPADRTAGVGPCTPGRGWCCGP